jgi:hypothetical protein
MESMRYATYEVGSELNEELNMVLYRLVLSSIEQYEYKPNYIMR